MFKFTVASTVVYAPSPSAKTSSSILLGTVGNSILSLSLSRTLQTSKQSGQPSNRNNTLSSNTHSIHRYIVDSPLQPILSAVFTRLNNVALNVTFPSTSGIFIFIIFCHEQTKQNLKNSIIVLHYAHVHMKLPYSIGHKLRAELAPTNWRVTLFHQLNYLFRG